MKALRLGTSIITMVVKDVASYPKRLITETLSLVARFGILMLLYAYVFELKGGVINGVTFQVIAWSTYFYFAFMVLHIRSISKAVMNDVRTGRVEVFFGKPVSYIMYRMWWKLGEGLYPFIVLLIIGVTSLAFFVPIPAQMLTPFFITTFTITALNCVALTLLLYSLVGLLAFWIEDANPVHWIVDKTVMILGGSWLPVALFPEFLYNLAVFTPFGALNFITHTVYDSWTSEWMLKIGMQFFWILVLGALCIWMASLARKQVSINGG